MVLHLSRTRFPLLFGDGQITLAANRLNPDVIFRRPSMNRRVFFVGAILAIAGFLAVHGAFSETDAQSKRRAINLPDRLPQAAFSSGILVGDTLYISGNIGLDPKTGKAPDKIEDEIKLLLDSYKTLLTQAGFTMDDLVYVQISCTDLAYYDKFNAAYKTYFTKDLPARQFVGVASLLRGGHFEMQAIAVKH
jgi:2-iminobutanoate/2-iminopropanoate deaminase